MKSFLSPFYSLLLILLLLFLFPLSVFAQEFPKPTGFVNDFAQVLSSETRETLENDLVSFERETTVEIAVVTVKSLGEITIEDYAVRLFEDWQIGKKEKDNGILLLVAPSEREVRIEVGYGLEPILTDAKAGRIIREKITPAFKEGDFDKGVVSGIEAIQKVAGGDEEVFSKTETSEAFLAVLLILFILLIYIAGFLARTRGFWAGGIIGAVFGVVAGVILGSLLILVLAAVGFGFWGLFLDYVLSRNYKQRKKFGLPTSWKSSWGGFSSGGSRGGFGGFGGGSSGGGGASGSW